MIACDNVPRVDATVQSLTEDVAEHGGTIEPESVDVLRNGLQGPLRLAMDEGRWARVLRMRLRSSEALLVINEASRHYYTDGRNTVDDRIQIAR